jgi:hypothetical protein
VVDRWDEDWRRLAWVIVEGRAEVHAAGPARARAIELLLDKYAQYRAMGLARAAGPVLAITPARILCWRADAG